MTHVDPIELALVEQAARRALQAARSLDTIYPRTGVFKFRSGDDVITVHVRILPADEAPRR